MPVIEPLNQTILRGARIVTPAGTLAATDLLIEDELISAIRPPLDNVSPARVIDLSQLTLYPGFIDLHIHGAVGVDTMTAGSEDLTRAGEFLARHGVTGWLPTLVPSPPEDYERAVKSIEKLVAKGSAPDAEPIRNPAARVLGVHYEGPFVNSEQCGALHGFPLVALSFLALSFCSVQHTCCAASDKCARRKICRCGIRNNPAAARLPRTTASVVLPIDPAANRPTLIRRPANQWRRTRTGR